MGRLVEQHAAAHGGEVVAIATTRVPLDGPGEPVDAAAADVAIDFSLPEAVPHNLPRLAARGMSVVIGTTGWHMHEEAMRDVVARTGIGVVVAANFSLGMAVFRATLAEAARRFAEIDDVGAWIHEAHHNAKKDAPSGTALMLRHAMTEAGYARAIDVSSTRAGHIPGTHTVGFDSRAETVTLTHTVRDRAVFAHGALQAARWLIGRRGWFTLDDVISQNPRT